MPDQLADTFQGVSAAGVITLPVISVNVQLFNTTGGGVTYTPTSGTRFVFVELLGGGAGGGGAAATAAGQVSPGGGGGGGAYGFGIITNVQPGAHLLGVGGGGAGGIGAGAAGNGVLTSFTKITGEGNTIPSANGGTAGGSGAASAPPIFVAGGGGGGYHNVADVITATNYGVAGGNGHVSWGLAAAQARSGFGGFGAGPFGGAGGQDIGGTAAGDPGQQWGGGGSGACAVNGGAAQTGGAGHQGLIKITEYIGPA